MSIPVHSSVLIPHSSTCSLTNTATIEIIEGRGIGNRLIINLQIGVSNGVPWVNVKARTQEHIMEHGMEVQRSNLVAVV